MLTIDAQRRHTVTSDGAGSCSSTEFGMAVSVGVGDTAPVGGQ